MKTNRFPKNPFTDNSVSKNYKKILSAQLKFWEIADSLRSCLECYWPKNIQNAEISLESPFLAQKQTKNKKDWFPNVFFIFYTFLSENKIFPEIQLFFRELDFFVIFLKIVENISSTTKILKVSRSKAFLSWKFRNSEYIYEQKIF